jgi:hypothetical protein
MNSSIPETQGVILMANIDLPPYSLNRGDSKSCYTFIPQDKIDAVERAIREANIEFERDITTDLHLCKGIPCYRLDFNLPSNDVGLRAFMLNLPK